VLTIKIIIQDPTQGEEESVTLKVRRMTENITRALNILKSPPNLSVYNEGQTFSLPVADIYYIESVDLKTFVYAEKAVFRTKLKLYEIEGILNGDDFLRISKQVIINIDKIKSVSPAGASRFLATLANGEKVIISRQYVPALKERFGL
jgi:DNA-binding LytR/AlgR family response regulator